MLYIIGFIITFLSTLAVGLIHHNKNPERKPEDIAGYALIAFMLAATSWFGLTILIVYKLVDYYVPKTKERTKI